MSTIREIAQLAGVSIATVSRVMNQPEKVSPEKRANIEALMAEFHYFPHPKKRRKATDLFAVIVPDITNPFFSQFLDVLEMEAYQHGRSILFFNSRHDRHKERVYLEECARHKVDGVFLIPLSGDISYLKELQSLPYPVVMLTQTSPFISSFGVDHKKGGQLAAKFLINKGHQQIGYVGICTDTRNSQEPKLLGFRHYLSTRNLVLNEDHCFDIKQDQDLTAFLLQCFASDKPPTAFFCMNDVTAEKLLNAMHSPTLTYMHEIPLASAARAMNKINIEVVGFDNSMTARVMHFSSISQPIREMAYSGFKEMLTLIKNKTKHNKDGSQHYNFRLFTPTLVERKS